MRKFKYRGESCNLGRSGRVEKGYIVKLTEQEAYSVRDNPDFIPQRDQMMDGFPEEPGLPKKGDYFDLASLSWKSERVFKEVDAMRRAKLTWAMKQLEAFGFPVPLIDSRTEEEHMRDILLTTGRQADWI